MAIVTLTTDLGNSDYYVAALKGNLLQVSKPISVVDISHLIRPFDILHASFTLNACYKDFPENTIHIIGINTELVVNSVNAQLPSIMLYDNHYFIANDNGIFDLILGGNKPEKFWKIDNVLSSPNGFYFPTKNIFVPTAKKIVEGEKIETFASESETWNRAHALNTIVSENVIKGTVIHIDHYGNVITNIRKEQFMKFGDAPFTILFKKREYHISQISTTYSDVQEGERLALFNSIDLLEIALNKGVANNGGSAATLLGLHLNDPIRIEFNPRGSATTIDSLF